MVNQIKSGKTTSIFRLLIFVAIIFVVNIIASKLHKRLDLTTEKRFTLSQSTQELLKELDDVLYIKVYLEGEGFPAGFKRLQVSTYEMLDEMKNIARNKLQFEFIDPVANVDSDLKQEVYLELRKKGLQPTNLKVEKDDSYSEKIIFPGAIISYKGRETPVLLLQNQISLGPEQVLNNSISLLEYTIASAIKKVARYKKPKIAFIKGHGELNNNEVFDITKELLQNYVVDTINLSNILYIPKDYSAIIVAKPNKPVGEKDKFKLDQYIMNGGNVLWLIETLKADMRLMGEKQAFVTQTYETNLEDQLFRYGVRINTDLVQDFYSIPIPLVVGNIGNAPQTQMYPWPYFPMVTPKDEHPIVKNLDAMMFQFANSIDTVRVKNVKKTILLTSSEYSKALLYPVRVHLSMLKYKPDLTKYTQKNLPLAVLLEGGFTSIFKNRLTPKTLQTIDSIDEIEFKEKSLPSKMIVVSDGDIMANEYAPQKGHYPLGFYRYTQQVFDNKNFLLNAIEYLADDNNLIAIRNREVKLRLLDKVRVKKEKREWQLFNTVLPIAIVLLSGLVFIYLRKRKYGK